MPSLTVEDYVKTIALIAAANPPGTAVGTGLIAQALHVSPGTVTGMLKTLSEANLWPRTRPMRGRRGTGDVGRADWRRPRNLAVRIGRATVADESLASSAWTTKSGFFRT